MANQVKSLFEIIQESAKTDDLDAALKPIQDALGQTDGGPAALFWSGMREECWPTDDFENRMSCLADYIKFEITWREWEQ